MSINTREAHNQSRSTMEANVKYLQSEDQTEGREVKEEVMQQSQEFGQRIMDLAVADPMINWLVGELFDSGLQSLVNDKGIEIVMEYAKYWTCEEENTLVTLWILLGRPEIRIIVDEEEIDKFLPYVYEGFWKTVKSKTLSSSIVQVNVEMICTSKTYEM
jgi:hypothetical protein